MMRLIHETDSLYLTPPQQGEVRDYAKSLARRFAACRAAEAAEPRMADAALTSWLAAHPELGPAEELGWPTAATDLRLAVRAAALGMLLDDPDYPEARVYGTLRRTLGYLDVPEGAVGGLFAAVREAARDGLPPDAYDALAPYLPAAEPVAA